MASTFWPFAGEHHGWTGFRRAVRAVPPPILHGMMAAAVLCVLAPALVHALHPAALFAAPLRVAAPLPAIDLPEPPRTRCSGCGVVEGIRPLPPIEGEPAGYEFTIRLRDGSVRTSTSTGKASWHVGDRILLLGGSDAQ
jgi:hypothetical protein